MRRSIWTVFFLFLSALADLALLAVPVRAEVIASDSVTPREWALLRINACSDGLDRRDADLARLVHTLSKQALSKEEQAFPEKEVSDFAKANEKERQIRLNRLNYLLFRSDQQVVKEVMRHQFPWASGFSQVDRESFGHSIEDLTEGASPCMLDALESTVLLAVFGLPLRRAWIEQEITPEQVLKEVEDEYTRKAKANRTLEQTYIELRPRDPNTIKLMIGAMIERIMRPTMSPLEPVPESQQKLISQIGQFIELAAEPLRIGQYLNMTVGGLETSIGIRLNRKSVDRLNEKIGNGLYGNAREMRKLTNATPQDNVEKMYPVIDEWFQKDALPELQERLFEDPFSAFWFYVQSGMVAEKPSAFQDARLRIDSGTLDLNALKGHSLEGALGILYRQRYPPPISSISSNLKRC
ncbi:MAG: hypothetical protein U0V70_04130 [Terriglobia bacterium]